jgi:transposase
LRLFSAITALAYVLVLGTPDRCGKQVGSYLGLIPREDSSADHCRLGHISKQGNALLRYLLVQSALSAARVEQKRRRQYAHLTQRRNHAVAKVAMARKLAVRMFRMWRRGWDYDQSTASPHLDVRQFTTATRRARLKAKKRGRVRELCLYLRCFVA